MYIGKLAQLTSCTPKAIRLYEDLGLLPTPARRGKYRVYTPHHADMVRIIRVAQAAGFKLSELRGVIEAKIQGDHFPLDLALESIEIKRQQVRSEIAALHEQDRRLMALGQEIKERFSQTASQPCEGRVRAVF